jgi:predicted unusual protein kinase regulating ubiquinone biosynthesis (AarF/ABC1/UbiB family)
VASASIGQVHKAVWSDGREVAVKIQYPGADEALRADLKTMQRMIGVIKQLAPGADVQGVVDELIERTEMELDYRLEADNQRAFAKAYEGHPHFLVPHIVASAPKVVVQEWIDGTHMAEIIRDGTVEQRDLLGFRLLELTFDAPRRLEMMHGDAHPGNFMLLPDGRMGVIDFGAVAPLPGGFPIELGMTIRLAREKNYDLLLPTMEKVGFIQKGQQVSVRDIDEMLRQYVQPVEVEVFHYTRRWLQKMTISQMDRSVSQIKTARQMDLPPKLAIPMRVIASVAAILCQLDAHVPIRALSEELIPGFAEPDTAVV